MTAKLTARPSANRTWFAALEFKANRERLFALLVMALFSWLLAACGGSGADEASGPSVRPIFDASVPPEATSTVVAVTSEAGTAKPGEPVRKLDLEGISERLLIASDASDNIILATIAPASDPTPNLSAETTAHALAVLMLGRTPSGFTSAQFSVAARTAPEFANLVRLVSAAHLAGTPPVDHPGVAQSIGLTQAQALSSAKTASGATRAKALSLADPLSLPLPGVVVSDVGGALTVRVVDADERVSGVKITNGFGIQFAARGTSALDGRPLGSLETADGVPQVVLPGSELVEFAGREPTSVPGNGSVWNLTVFRSGLIQRQDKVQLALDIFKAVADRVIPVGSECTADESLKALAESLIAAKGINGFTALLDGRELWDELSEVLESCVGDALQKNAAAGVTKGLREQMQQISKTVLALAKKVLVVYDVANLGTRFFLIEKYEDFSTSVGICQARETPTSPLRVISCPARFVTTPAEFTMRQGTQQLLNVLVFDSANKLVPVPSTTEYSSSRPDIAKVDEKGNVTAVAISAEPAEITVYDPIFNLGSLVYVHVKAAQLSVAINPVSVPIGSPATLTWSSTNTTACKGTGPWSEEVATSGSRMFTPATAGSYDIGVSCQALGSEVASKVTLIVTDPVVVPTTGVAATGITSAQCVLQKQDPNNPVPPGRSVSQKVLGDCGSAQALQFSGAAKQDGMRPGGFQFTNVIAPSGVSQPRTQCVRDAITNLDWEVKTVVEDGASFGRGVNRTAFFEDVARFVLAANTSQLCGYSDWRLPTADELYTLVDHGVSERRAALPLSGFPEAIAITTSPGVGEHWTSTNTIDGHLAVNFLDFLGKGQMTGSRDYNDFRFRLVRGQMASGRLQASDSEVYDTRTGLTWKRCPEGQSLAGGGCSGTPLLLTRDQAFERVKALPLWRVPNAKELMTLVDRKRGSPNIDTTLFPSFTAFAVANNVFWTSTPVVDAASAAVPYQWGVSFWSGVPMIEATHSNFEIPRPLLLVR